MTTIYVIKHKEMENCNVFTTQKEKIPEIISKLLEKYESEMDEWSYLTLQEEQEFEGDIKGHNTRRLIESLQTQKLPKTL